MSEKAELLKRKEDAEQKRDVYKDVLEKIADNTLRANPRDAAVMARQALSNKQALDGEDKE